MEGPGWRGKCNCRFHSSHWDKAKLPLPGSWLLLLLLFEGVGYHSQTLLVVLGRGVASSDGCFSNMAYLNVITMFVLFLLVRNIIKISKYLAFHCFMNSWQRFRGLAVQLGKLKMFKD